MNNNTLTITQPDDWHIHLREGVYLQTTVADASKHLGRALVMPNLQQPILTTEDAMNYRQQILLHSINPNFNPLMTLYLTNTTSTKDVYQAAQNPYIKGIKWYPKHGTTLSSHAVDNIDTCADILSAMSECQLPLLIHGELPQYSVFDREANFIKQIMQPLAKKYPTLPMVVDEPVYQDLQPRGNKV